MSGLIIMLCRHRSGTKTKDWHNFYCVLVCLLVCMARSQRVEVYLPTEMLDRVEQEVEESDEYESRSGFIREATKEFLSNE
jgi:hypothetical protein